MPKMLSQSDMEKLPNCKYSDNFDEDIEEEIRQCDETCSHYDSLNECCWQATEKGLCFDVKEGDYCILGRKQDSDSST